MRRLAAILMIAATAACTRPLFGATSVGSSTGEASPATPSPVTVSKAWPAGRTFVSTAVTEDGHDHRLAPGTTITLTFRKTTGIQARAGCNYLDLTVHLVDKRIIADEIGQTAMGCDSDRLAQDQWIRDVLSTGPMWQLTDDRLVLTAGTTTIRLTDHTLTQNRWEVTGSVDHGTTMAVPASRAFVTFTDGTVTATTGCATLTGTATFNGQTATIGTLDRVEQSCDVALADLDALVTHTMRGTLTVRVDDSILALTTVDGGVMTLRARS